MGGNELQPKFNYGDLVRVAGYYPQVFRILGYRIEQYHYPDEDWSELVYELTGAYNSEWLEADEDDLSIVSVAAKAEEYLRKNQPAVNYGVYVYGIDFGVNSENTGGDDEMAEDKPKEVLTPVEHSEIDNLLEMRYWYAGMLEKTGDAAYEDRVIAIDAELKKLTDTEYTAMSQKSKGQRNDS